ncbi:hypothetical protein SERLA73DRAFT_48387 [Serpula lacrymans var. lacrymans S7.3]|uniref:Protein kinase domain-containing protein n=2 Tax=Serpula lacrymans var. lacrymans TaxID=341189 RepID=F8PQK9_SERL3|nr:hypothetical protein SERLA73DRAFT_48387 [Serpula lacrymans var. lacrymans S7.3]
MWWRDRQPYLASRGYMLRPRYHAGWKPSWLGTNVDPEYCEDSIEQLLPQILDARKDDGTVVCLKKLKCTTNEIEIARYLTSQSNPRDSRNHCVPILDTFHDPIEPETTYIAMPLLRPFDDPEFGAFGEVLDFINQTLEGIAFMHSLNVAHRDCAGPNIMMDARPLYTQEWHPVRRNYTTDGVYELQPRARIDFPVRYFFVDFGLATRFEPGQPRRVTGGKGRDQDVPELSNVVPYDPFKVDVFILGHLYQTDFHEKFHGLDALVPLVHSMTAVDPSVRPSAQLALNIFQEVRNEIETATLRRRLARRDESFPERVFNDALAAVRESAKSLAIGWMSL